jgi:hypothetical protein
LQEELAESLKHKEKTKRDLDIVESKYKDGQYRLDMDNKQLQDGLYESQKRVKELECIKDKQELNAKLATFEKSKYSII